MITLETEPWPKKAPNPPPWQVEYLSDEDSRRDAVPLAYTIGLLQLGHAEIQLRKAPPQTASLILDRLGIWLAYENGRMEPGQTFIIHGVHYFTISGFDNKGLRVFRLAWYKDPADQLSPAKAIAHP